MPVWVKARKESDFSQFLPALRHNFDLRRRYVECFDDYDEPYDVLLDDFEPGMKTAEVRDGLRPAQAGAGAARRGGPRRRGAAASAASPSRSKARSEFELEGDPALRLRPVGVAARHGRPSLRRLDRDHRHPPDDAVLRRQPRRPLRDDARVRPRPLRARGRPRARAHAARERRLARPARVAEPHVGEHGRPQPPVLALLLSRAAAARSPTRSGARRSRTGTARSTGSSRR